MTKKELIDLLEICPPETEIHVWDPYYDKETDIVSVHMNDGSVLISNV
jgi:hypothetical protein